jgi:hypothetical protein
VRPVARALIVLAVAQLNHFLLCKKSGFEQCSPKNAKPIKALKTLFKASQARATHLASLYEARI